MRGRTLRLFLLDRLPFVFVGFVIIGLCVSLLLLERARYSGLIDYGTIYYFVLLSLFCLGAWLLIDYMRQRAYFRQMHEAMRKSGELKGSTIVKSPVTLEQKLVAGMLEEQNHAYMDELSKYRRRQELHNHFVLQWVHHMKTPASVIDLLVQEARQKGSAPEEEQGRLLDSVQEETDRLTRGLEMMLYTARLDKFELDVHIRQTPLHESIRSVINANKKLFIRHSIFPKVIGEALAETDEKWMTFVLGQFVTNAIKFSKSKPGSKTILFRIEQEGGGCKLSVTDEGIGIAPHDLPRIFDPFFTGENGRMTGESTGMGLYLAKQVCGRLGHSVAVSSVVGEGTTFSVHFKPGGIHLFSRENEA